MIKMHEVRSQLPVMAENPERRERWAYLTEGIKDDYKRRVTEVLLDNQLQDLHQRAARGPLYEDVVTTANVGPFTTFMLPLVRRVYPTLIAQDLVSVQPMTQPTGKVFYFDTTYSAAGSPPVAQRVDLLANFQINYASNVPEIGTVPELSLSISSANISAESKKLKAKWSLESEQDLFAYHGLDAQNELMTAVSGEIAREIDREIITDLFNFAGAGNVIWDALQPTSGPWATQSPKEWGRTLYDSIVDANNLIVKKRYRNATWIVASATDCTRMEKLEAFRLFPAASPGTPGTIVTGPHLFGTIEGRFAVYKDPWLADGTILLGYRGDTPLDTGYVYSPYIPLMATAPFTDPNTLTTVRAMMTRYAKQGVIPEMYATVTIINGSGVPAYEQ